jgi:hypothetical protein
MPSQPSGEMYRALLKASSKSFAFRAPPFFAVDPAACFAIISNFAFCENRAIISGAVPMILHWISRMSGAEI